MWVIGVFSDRPNKFIFENLVEKMLVKMRRFWMSLNGGNFWLLNLRCYLMLNIFFRFINSKRL